MSSDPTIQAQASDGGAGNAVPADAASRLASDGDAVPAPESAGGPEQDVPAFAPTSAEEEQEPEAAAEAELAAERDLEAEADAYLAELTAKAEKADEYLGLAQRTKADFENYRKRSIREAALAQERGIARLAKELLPAMDNLDRALTAVETHKEDNHEQLVSGIKLVHADVISALNRAGIEAFSPEGEPFDPQWHEAVAQQPLEGAVPGTVAEVYQRGYKLGETVLRPARVLVAA
jgi:molecular chaperone GrpE